jgi:hypothetical protein
MPAEQQPPAAPPAPAGPVISHNLPQQTSCRGQNYLELDLDASYFLAQAIANPTGGPR